MKIVCAHSVTAGEEAFGSVADELVLVHESEISPEHLRGADALITRTKTKITRDLVAGSGLAFYATCTAGSDHVDTAALADEGIAWADAKGCNANAVAEFVTTALLGFASRYGLDLSEHTLGIVGHGHVGKAVEEKARILGLQVLLNDPPLEASGGAGDTYVPLEEVLARATLLTLHVPLVETGPWPTRHLLNGQNLAGIRPEFLINTCRGEVAETAALLPLRPFRAMVLDVWDPEPDYPVDLFKRVDFGSPHVAGHTLEGKIMGTAIASDKLRAHFGLAGAWDPSPLLPPVEGVVDVSGLHPHRALRNAVSRCVHLRTDHNLMAMWPEADRGRLFTERRRHYPLRREFGAVQVACGDDAALADLLGRLGFRT